jgi:hypothetical protein
VVAYDVPKAEYTISQAEVAELVGLFDGVIERLRDLEKRVNPDMGGSVEPGPLTLGLIDEVDIYLIEEVFRDNVVPGEPSWRQADPYQAAQLELNRKIEALEAGRKGARAARKLAKRGGRQ